jgi:hypothetical protein
MNAVYIGDPNPVMMRSSSSIRKSGERNKKNESFINFKSTLNKIDERNNSLMITSKDAEKKS